MIFRPEHTYIMTYGYAVRTVRIALAGVVPKQVKKGTKVF